MKKIREGSVEIFLDSKTFYNPDAELIRDISISALAVFQKQFNKPLTICDALSATGIRGLRCAKEVSGVREVLLNDSNPKAVKLIKKNISLNKLKKLCKASWSDANKLLFSGKVFDFIDLDPFGSPARFTDPTARSIFHKGFVGITATDTAALCGAKSEACLRKYGIKTLKTDFYQEIGLRNLISFSILAFAKWDKAFLPMLSFSHKHYYRIFGKIGHAGEISKLLKEFAFISYCKKCLNRKINVYEKCDYCKKPMEIFGPIYLGKINDKNFCSEVQKEISTRNFKQKFREIKLLKNLAEEADAPIFYYDINRLCSAHKKTPLKLEKIISNLKKKKFSACRTYLNPTAIRTDAGLREILKKA